MTAYQAKIVPPRLHRVIHRERLFNLLDSLGEYPVTWVTSPAGAGKTTLVASYAQVRGIPVLWYRVDETDTDVASFFYYMREATRKLRKGRTKPLPLFTPEYHPGIMAFTRRYFASLFDRMSRPAMIVLDNYQDVPEDSSFHEVMREGLRQIPDGIRVLVVSREEPPAPLISLKAESFLSSIGWDGIRFTLDEVREMLHLRHNGPVPEETVQKIHEETRGWAAAVILMQDGNEILSLDVSSIGQRFVFDYFTVEVFGRLNGPAKEFLLTTSLLPGITPEIARDLTGMEASAHLLDHLSRNHSFTDRYGSEYRYHPLFREFLLTRAEALFTPERIREVRRKAGRLLLETGQTEEAIDLLTLAEDWETLIPVILGQAEPLMGEGRSKTLENWIIAIPEEIRSRTPWLLYWMGVCRRDYDPAGGFVLFYRAFGLFAEDDDRTGLLLSWCGAVTSIIYDYRDTRPLQALIEWLDNFVGAGFSFPSTEVECMVASAMAGALITFRPDHPGLMQWMGRTVSLAADVTHPYVRLEAYHYAVLVYVWLGDFTRWAMISEDLERTAKSGGPLFRICALFNRASLMGQAGPDPEAALPIIEEGLRMSAATGIVVWIPLLTGEGVYGALNRGDLKKAGEFLAKLEPMGDAPQYEGHYHGAAALYHLLSGNIPRSLAHGEEALRAARRSGSLIHQALMTLYLVFILLEAGRPDEAQEQIAAYRAMPPTPSRILEYTYGIAEAALALHSGSPDTPDRLRKAFSLARQENYVSPFYWWQPSLMVRLCKEALSHGIEVEYVRHVIRSRNLTPHEPPIDVHAWPWPYKIATLGEFRIEVNNEPLAFSGKVQKRPLTLLKVLVAMGGREIRQDEIENILWPEADGDMARISFKTTLSRLRKLLGNEQVIEVKEGKVSLNARHVWLDTWALEHLAEQVAALTGAPDTKDGIDHLASLVMQVYQGAFLQSDDDPWIILYRDRFSSRFLRTIRRLTDRFRSMGEPHRARFLYDHAIDRGFSPEEVEGQGRSLNRPVVVR